MAHRLVYAYHTGEWPDVLDHKDRNKSNNAFENLRSVTHAENILNQVQPKGLNKYRGVHKKRKMYQARLTIDGKRISLGCYKTPEEANEVYLKARKEAYPHIFEGD